MTGTMTTGLEGVNHVTLKIEAEPVPLISDADKRMKRGLIREEFARGY